MQVLFTTFLEYKWMSQEYTLGKSNNLVTPWTNLKIKKTDYFTVRPWKIDCWFPITWGNFHRSAGRLLIFFFFFFHFFSRIIHVQYAPNNHTSVIPLCTVNNSVLFLYLWAWKEGEKK
jgi:hypothetical protein